MRQKNTGKLAAHFITVVNNRAKDMALIREGNERVLAARLADAKFFFDEDRKVRLEERTKKLGGVTFHQKLGTMAQNQSEWGNWPASLSGSCILGKMNFDRCAIERRRCPRPIS